MRKLITRPAEGLIVSLLVAVLPAAAQAQNHSHMDHSGMEGIPMEVPATPASKPEPQPKPTQSMPEAVQQHAPTVDHSHMGNVTMDHTEHGGMAMPMNMGQSSEGSGTARLPANEGMHGLHIPAGSWTIMAHGDVSLQYTNVSGPRGDDKLYATSMAMLSGERETSWGRIQLRSMFSLEPLMSARGYPNLFATGETAGGSPLVDRQHPHDLFMELAARADFNLGADTRLFIYGGPVGEPAIGPSAFMHRGSAAYNPEAPITHHWFDSTHITYGVATVGLAGKGWQIEGSGFRGAEPDEYRWDIETPKIDSWSVRATLTPSPSWVVQASYAQIHQPEALHPGEDEHRFTASAHYDNAHGLSAMLAFSNKERVPGGSLSAWLAEANWNIDQHNTVFGRFENVANDELFPDHASPLHDQAFRVSKFQLGYARRMPIGPVELALGAAASAYAKPSVLDPYYGNNPVGYTLFARLNLGM